MGLDMYLSTRKELSAYDFEAAEDKALFARVMRAAGLEMDDVSSDSPSGTLIINVMYWRKANAIHNWFVQHVQGGLDNCREYYVDRENLQALQRDLTTALTDKDRAPKVLPTAGGFFFGGTEYDDWYWKNLRYSLLKINFILANPRMKDLTFYYQSSW